MSWAKTASCSWWVPLPVADCACGMRAPDLVAASTALCTTPFSDTSASCGLMRGQRRCPIKQEFPCYYPFELETGCCHC